MPSLRTNILSGFNSYTFQETESSQHLQISNSVSSTVCCAGIRRARPCKGNIENLLRNSDGFQDFQSA